MSAVLRSEPVITPMLEADLPDLMQVEERIYEFPWSAGNFRDSIRAGYGCWVYRSEGAFVGYCVFMVAAGEAHLLNISIAEAYQRQGYGARLLREILTAARDQGAALIFLEVRPSNEAGLRLYERFGFRHVGKRRGYYPAKAGREDALVLALDL